MSRRSDSLPRNNVLDALRRAAAWVAGAFAFRPQGPGRVRNFIANWGRWLAAATLLPWLFNLRTSPSSPGRLVEAARRLEAPEALTFLGSLYAGVEPFVWLACIAGMMVGIAALRPRLFAAFGALLVIAEQAGWVIAWRLDRIVGPEVRASSWAKDLGLAPWEPSPFVPSSQAVLIVMGSLFGATLVFWLARRASGPVALVVAASLTTHVAATLWVQSAGIGVAESSLISTWSWLNLATAASALIALGLARRAITPPDAPGAAERGAGREEFKFA